ncbi:P-loop containing nucleoside triphosphate hydrolase protein [Pelagophyceae sp. CCMP2097]|nr:P-loop containing nucleoside triphosphate hydrolase protein [Pelagophyceae sp. CCMP2097]
MLPLCRGRLGLAPLRRSSSALASSAPSTAPELRRAAKRSHFQDKDTTPRAYAHRTQLRRQAAKQAEEAHYFWRCVDDVRNGEAPPGAKSEPLSQEELFGNPWDLVQEKNIEEEAPSVKRSGGGAAVEILAKWSDLGDLPGFVRYNLTEFERLRFTRPTPIQSHAVPLALSGQDVLASAQTGSGKTMAFLVPLVAAVLAAKRDYLAEDDAQRRQRTGPGRSPVAPSALILAPTRELAIQIDLEVQKLTFGEPVPGASADLQHVRRWSVAIYGGASARPQLEALAGGAEIMVATPGRLADFTARNLVSLRNCRFVVLDEADRMLDMGFESELKLILQNHDLPPIEERQTLMFSATFPKTVQEVALKYLRTDAARLEVGTEGAPNKLVAQALQRVLASEPKNAMNKRGRFIFLVPVLVEGERTIVFFNKKHQVTWAAGELTKLGWNCVAIHGDRSQAQREESLQDFRDGRVDLLLATDAVSRGIDVEDVMHVVQFDLPSSTRKFHEYVHRVGRTGRDGTAGRATALYDPDCDAELWHDLKRAYDQVDQKLPRWFRDLQPLPGKVGYMPGPKQGARQPWEVANRDKAKNPLKPEVIEVPKKVSRRKRKYEF